MISLTSLKGADGMKQLSAMIKKAEVDHEVNSKNSSKKLIPDDVTEFFTVVLEPGEDGVAVAYPIEFYKYDPENYPIFVSILGDYSESITSSTGNTRFLYNDPKLRCESFVSESPRGPDNKLAEQLLGLKVSGRVLLLSCQYDIEEEAFDTVNFSRKQVLKLAKRLTEINHVGKVEIIFSATPCKTFSGEEKPVAADKSLLQMHSGIEAFNFIKEKVASSALEDEKLRLNRAKLRSCGACHKEGAKQICSGCGFVRYCGRECQTAAWKSHKTTCKK